MQKLGVVARARPVRPTRVELTAAAAAVAASDILYAGG